MMGEVGHRLLEHFESLRHRSYAGTKILPCMSLLVQPAPTSAEILSWAVTVCPKQCAGRVPGAVQTLRSVCTSQGRAGVVSPWGSSRAVGSRMHPA